MTPPSPPPLSLSAHYCSHSADEVRQPFNSHIYFAFIRHSVWLLILMTPAGLSFFLPLLSPAFHPSFSHRTKVHSHKHTPTIHTLWSCLPPVYFLSGNSKNTLDNANEVSGRVCVSSTSEPRCHLSPLLWCFTLLCPPPRTPLWRFSWCVIMCYSLIFQTANEKLYAVFFIDDTCMYGLCVCAYKQLRLCGSWDSRVFWLFAGWHSTLIVHSWNLHARHSAWQACHFILPVKQVRSMCNLTFSYTGSIFMSVKEVKISLPFVS